MGFLSRILSSREEEEYYAREKEREYSESSYSEPFSDEPRMSGDEYAKYVNNEIRREFSR